MNNSPLEFLAKKYGNVVKYDDNGNIIGIFVRFYKRNSSELADELPDHVHPAFIINGEEQDSILIGKYKVGENGGFDGPLVSMPNLMPVEYDDVDELLSGIRSAGNGISGMTCADYGFIKLLAQKEGWTQRGNTYFGQSSHDGNAWAVGYNIKIGEKRAYNGYLYACLIAHTSAVELRPDNAPEYWKQITYIGGVVDMQNYDNMHQSGGYTANGTGPLDWYLGNDPGNICDVIGSCYEAQYGYRIVDCELQIMENNNAADPSADLSAESSSWKAILPNQSDDGYTLVAPGTTGTLHWNWDGNKIQLDTQLDQHEGGRVYRTQAFSQITANPERLPYVPSIVKELGIFPTTDDKTIGDFEIIIGSGEYFPVRGGRYNSVSGALGRINVTAKRSLVRSGGRAHSM